MYAHAGIVLGVMAAVFALARVFKISTELSMLAAAIGGAIAHGAWIPARQIVDGAFTYFDVTLIFITATFFMNLVKHSGGVNLILRGIIRRFHRHRALTLLFLALVMLIPGAFTGAGSVTVLVMGAMVATILTYMGIREDRVAAIIFLCAAMSAAAPPINLWAMMAAAGSNMPYVGFFLPLGIVAVLGSVFSMFYLGWKGTPVELNKIMEELPEAPKGMCGWKVTLPFVVLIGLILAGRLWPWSMPTLGLPLMFLIAGATAALVSPVRLPLFKIARETVEGLLPLIGVMVVVGILVQIMALSGARGLISLGVVILPLAVIFGTLWLILPFSEGLVQYAAAPLLGVPLILLFNMKGINPIIALSGMAVMFPIGDMLPPTSVVGRATTMTIGYKGSYYKGLVRQALVPAAFILALGTLYIVFGSELKFLVAG
jgi:TRAP-type C4-dicarboxylate transport system permease large subunit